MAVCPSRWTCPLGLLDVDTPGEETYPVSHSDLQPGARYIICTLIGKTLDIYPGHSRHGRILGLNLLKTLRRRVSSRLALRTRAKRNISTQSFWIWFEHCSAGGCTQRSIDRMSDHASRSMAVPKATAVVEVGGFSHSHVSQIAYADKRLLVLLVAFFVLYSSWRVTPRQTLSLWLYVSTC